MGSRYPVLSVAAAILLGVCTGCAGSHPAKAQLGPNGQAPGFDRPTPNAPYIIPEPKRSAAPAAASVPAQDVPPCDPKVLRVEEISGNSNGNYRSAKLAFGNSGDAVCRLGGYPLVALRGSSIRSVAAQQVTWAEAESELQPHKPANTSPGPAEVTLMPHEVAAFQVVWTTGSACPHVNQILVTPPGTNRVFAVTQPTRICAGNLQVTKLRLDPGDD